MKTLKTFLLTLELCEGELQALVAAVAFARANATGREENTLACVQDRLDEWQKEGNKK